MHRNVHSAPTVLQYTLRTTTKFGFAVNSIRIRTLTTTYLSNARMCHVFLSKLSALIGFEVSTAVNFVTRPSQEVAATPPDTISSE